MSSKETVYLLKTQSDLQMLFAVVTHLLKGCLETIIQFNSIRVYLRANLRTQRPITKLARVHINTQK
jgi:hypothetical protein